MEDKSSGKDLSFLDRTDKNSYELGHRPFNSTQTTNAGTNELKESDLIVCPNSENNLPKSKIDRVEYEDGRVYTGGLFHGTPHGIGQMIYPDGCSYYGNFQFGLMHGSGHQIFIDKSEYKGPYSNGLKMGVGLYKSTLNADWEEVEYTNDIRKQKPRPSVHISSNPNSSMTPLGFKSLNLDRDSLHLERADENPSTITTETEREQTSFLNFNDNDSQKLIVLLKTSDLEYQLKVQSVKDTLEFRNKDTEPEMTESRPLDVLNKSNVRMDLEKQSIVYLTPY